MSDSPVEISHATLRSLHRIHRQLTDLEGQTRAGPRQVKAGQVAQEAARTELEEAREALKRAKVACDQKQLQLKEREQRVEDLGTKLNTAASNIEFQTFKDQIAADKQANVVLADEILDAMEALDQQTEALTQKEADFKQREADHKAMVADVEKRMESLASEVARVREELVETEKQLPASIRETYDRLIKGHGEDALAPVESESCGNCGVTFSPQMMNKLMLSHLMMCSSCGSLLYMPEDCKA